MRLLCVKTSCKHNVREWVSMCVCDRFTLIWETEFECEGLFPSLKFYLCLPYCEQCTLNFSLPQFFLLKKHFILRKFWRSEVVEYSSTSSVLYSVCHDKTRQTISNINVVKCTLSSEHTLWSSTPATTTRCNDIKETWTWHQIYFFTICVSILMKALKFAKNHSFLQ